jgi:hypothetical protein
MPIFFPNITLLYRQTIELSWENFNACRWRMGGSRRSRRPGLRLGLKETDK